MAYITYSAFHALYPDISEAEFNRYSYDASRLMDAHTTGVDNYRKLSEAYPSEDEYADEAIKRCCAKLTALMREIDKAESSAVGYVTRADGTVVSKAVSSISSGSESISYSTSGGGSALSAAISDKAARDALYADTMKAYLSGVTDANGINLLYMGAYPNV